MLLVEWLTELSRDRQVHIRIGAAQALGVVCGLDFPSMFANTVRQWADSDDLNQRMAAAVALDQAARHPRMRSVVRSILRNWVRGHADAERWTAAAALRYDIGLQDVDRSLDDLRIVGTWEQRVSMAPSDLLTVACRSAATLFGAGQVEPVLRHIRGWLLDRRCNYLALGTILCIMTTRARDADPEAYGIPGDRLPWPLVVALHARDTKLGGDLADLIWQGLRRAPAQEIGIDVLSRWARQIRQPDATADSSLPGNRCSTHHRPANSYYRTSSCDSPAPVVVQ
jgi:hypothetical protein